MRLPYTTGNVDDRKPVPRLAKGLYGKPDTRSGLCLEETGRAIKRARPATHHKDQITDEKPGRLIGDKAYDSDPLDEELATLSIEMIAPHKSNRQKAKTQGGRKLRRYKRRWKVERLLARLQDIRRILVRYEYHDDNYVGFVHLGCILILLMAYF